MIIGLMETKTSIPRRIQHQSAPIDLIEAPWGFGGTDNLAQEGAHSILTEQELVKQLTAVGMDVNVLPASALGPFEIQEEAKKIRNLEAILTVNDWLAEKVKDSLSKGHIPVTLGGDGSLSLGSISGLIDFYGKENKDEIGIIWFSNHMHNSSPRVTKSWNANRMLFTALTFTGDAKHPDFIELMNFRNNGTPILDKKNIVHLGINHKLAQDLADHRYFTMEDIDDLGVKNAMNEAIEGLSHCRHIHLIIDVNSFDLSGVSNYSLGQLNYREALSMARIIDLNLRRRDLLRSIDVVEHCPSREAWDKRGETAAWITDIICNIFGENIFNAARKY